MPLWDDVKSNLAEWYTATSEKTSELARVSSRKYDKFGISREIERQFSELGSLVYTGLKEGNEDFLADQTLQGLISRIQELETELKEKDREIDDIKAEYGKKQAASRGAGAGNADDSEIDDPQDYKEAAAATIITDPILAEGRDESAILVEPMLDPEDTNRENLEP